MTVPKRRLSKMKGRMRRSHYHASVPTVTICACGNPVRPHSFCPVCKKYRGRDFVKPQPAATEAGADKASADNG